jgi:hypothetical protein
VEARCKEKKTLNMNGKTYGIIAKVIINKGKIYHIIYMNIVLENEKNR